MAQVAYAIIWWFILLVIGLIAFPLVSRVCNRLPDKGYSISKILGLLLLTYFSWLFSSLHILKFGYINVSLSLFLLLALSLYLSRKSSSLNELPLKSMLISEALFTIAFALFLVYLRYKPDIFYAYGEDFMDFAFLQSILRSDYFPPSDPWLAGVSLPYYYGGQLVTAVLTLISRVPSFISYNLAVAMFFGLLVSASYGIGYNVTRRKLYGLVAVVFVCLAGFISGVFQLSAFAFHHELLGHSATDAHGYLDWFLHFDVSSGVIPHTGNLYPYASFLQGDLHAHMMSMPFQLMYIMLILSLLRKGDQDERNGRLDWLLTIFILGISLGFFCLVNTWDYPIYIAFTLFAFIFFKLNINKRAILGIILVSLILYVPYFITRDWGGTHGVGIVHGRTDLADFVELFALLLFVVFSFFYVLFRGKLFKGETLILMTVLAIIIASVSFLLNFQLLLVLIPLALVPLYCIFKARERNETEFMLLLVLMGVLIVLFCEIFFIADALSPPFQRFNTVMKLYLPVWIFLGIASAYGVFWVSKNTKGKLKGVWVAALVVLILCCLIQPVGQTIGWASGKRDYFNIGRGTLDGAAYVKTIAPGEYEAIQWINRHIKGQPVILEAPGGAYQFSSYVATMTGLPTVVGWVTHEVMWRGSWDLVAGRDTDVDNIYKSPDSDRTLALLRKYNVEYVYVGKLEKEKYPAESLQKFTSNPGRYKLVYENQGAKIYLVLQR
jgi:YYY domain-containing protein